MQLVFQLQRTAASCVHALFEYSCGVKQVMNLSSEYYFKFFFVGKTASGEARFSTCKVRLINPREYYFSPENLRQLTDLHLIYQIT